MYEDEDLGIVIPETHTYDGDVHAVRDWIEQTADHHGVQVDPGLMPHTQGGHLMVEHAMTPDSQWQGTSIAEPGDIIHFDPKNGFGVQVNPETTARITAEFDKANADRPKWEAGQDRADPLAGLPVAETVPGIYHFTEPMSPAQGMDVMYAAETRLAALPDDRAWTPDEIRLRTQQLNATPSAAGPTFDGLPLDHERTLGEKAQVQGARNSLSSRDQQQFVKAGGANPPKNRSAKFARH